MVGLEKRLVSIEKDQMYIAFNQRTPHGFYILAYSAADLTSLLVVIIIILYFQRYFF